MPLNYGKGTLGGNLIVVSPSAQTLLLANVQDSSLNTHHLINAASWTDGQNNIQTFIAHLCPADYTLAIQIWPVYPAVPANASVWVRCLVVWDG